MTGYAGGYSDTYYNVYDYSVAEILGPWNFAVYVYIAFDPATSADPQWIDVTGYVELASAIRITHGRPDAEQNPQTTTCTLTVDNSDGRWSTRNPNGAWAGRIRKGAWLRADVVPPSGTTSTRFVGFIQQLPVKWTGQYASTQISASDRMVLLGNAPNFQTMITEELLADPQGGPYIIGYWPLHEPSGAAYVSDVSGQAPANQSTLTVRSQGVSAGTGISFSNTASPGYDGTSTVTFSPTGTTTFFGDPGPCTLGSYLQGAVGPSGNVSIVSCWIQTTSLSQQPIWSWTDPASNYGIWCGIEGAAVNSQPGCGIVVQYPLNGVTTVIGNEGSIDLGPENLCDGEWHQITVQLITLAATAGTANAGNAILQVWIDGTFNVAYLLGSNPLSNIVPITTLSRFTLGGAESWQQFNTNPLPGQVSLFTGSISELMIGSYPSEITPDLYGAWQAGTTMWQSPNDAYSVPESCGRRVIRLASYTGVPVPEASYASPGYPSAKDVALGTTSFINIPAETSHPAGLQQLVGQQPLTLMQQAANTENMPLFVDRQGRLTLQPSTLRQNPTVAFTINALDLDPSTEWADDFQYLQNQQQITPSGQGMLTVNINGEASQVLTGIYPNSVTTVSTNALEAASLGAAMNLAGADPAPRHNPLACEVATLSAQAGYGAAWYDAVLAAEISSVVEITNWPEQSDSASTGTYYIEGYTETIGAGTHMFAWNTSPTQGPTYQLDSPTLGRLDTPGLTLAY
jgi:hypothetical protein